MKKIFVFVIMLCVFGFADVYAESLKLNLIGKEDNAIKFDVLVTDKEIIEKGQEEEKSKVEDKKENNILVILGVVLVLIVAIVFGFILFKNGLFVRK